MISNLLVMWANDFPESWSGVTEPERVPCTQKSDSRGERGEVKGEGGKVIGDLSDQFLNGEVHECAP
jgi:hypothetical protein